MKIGVVGTGKLGLPMAVTIGLSGHEVVAYDRDGRRMSIDALSPRELDTKKAGSLRDQAGAVESSPAWSWYTSAAGAW